MKLDITFSENNMNFKPLFSDANIIDVEEDYYKDIISGLEHDKQELNQEIDNLEEEIKQTAVEQYEKGKEDGFVEGQESMVDESKLLPRTETGNPISLKDVSELPHKVKCNISRKNLFNNDTSLIQQLTFTGTNGTFTRTGYEIELPVGTYTIKAIPKKENLGHLYIYGYIVNKNNMLTKTAHLVVGTDYRIVTFTIEEGERLLEVNGTTNTAIAAAKDLFDKFNIQLEVGGKATEYEPYIDLT